MIVSFTGEHEFLSNFHEHPFMLPALPGTWFNTAEHAYQAAKAMSGVDWAKIVRAPTPYQAKKIGRAIDCRPDWDQVKRQVMLEVLMAKFSMTTSGNDLPGQLRDTGDAVLVEGNTWNDRYWGAVLTVDDPVPAKLLDLPWWRDIGTVYAGHNWLGRILMMVREVL